MSDQIVIINQPPQYDFAAILARHELADTTKYRYGREVEAARGAGVNLFDATAVADYAAALPSSRKMFLRAAIRLIANEITAVAKANATPDNVAAMQATMWRSEALKDAIHVKAHTRPPVVGQRLNLAEVRSLMQLPDVATKSGLRDRVVLALLVGAGLRRDELVNLAWDDITTDGERTVLKVIGKGDKGRPIPISEALVSLLGKWGDAIDPEGYIVRSVTKGGQVGDGMTGQSILDIVDRYGRLLGKDKLRPHDLRRTYARIGYDAGVDIGQISLLLGHASIKTTQIYLGLEIDMHETISDFIPV